MKGFRQRVVCLYSLHSPQCRRRTDSLHSMNGSEGKIVRATNLPRRKSPRLGQHHLSEAHRPSRLPTLPKPRQPRLHLIL